MVTSTIRKKVVILFVCSSQYNPGRVTVNSELHLVNRGGGKLVLKIRPRYIFGGKYKYHS